MFDSVPHVVGDANPAEVSRFGGDPEELRDHLLTAAAFKGSVAGDGAKKRGAETVNVGRRRRGLAFEYLGCGERRRCGDDTRRGLKAAFDPCNTEVGQL